MRILDRLARLVATVVVAVSLLAALTGLCLVLGVWTTLAALRLLGLGL